MSGDSEMAYAARAHGKPGFCAVAVDLPQYQRDTARTVAQWIREGLTVERTTVAAARDGLIEYLSNK